MAGQFALAPLGALALDAAASLHRGAFTPFGERAWTRQDMAELLASPGVKGLLLTHGERPVGFALCRVVSDEAELLTIAVDPACRRQGAASQILNAIVEDIVGTARDLYLEVAVDNPGALALYRRFGFEEVGRRTRYYERAGRERADALVLRLKRAG
jgi:[ribosomal protein S18]-alanine N-acetyltransferase